MIRNQKSLFKTFCKKPEDICFGRTGFFLTKIIEVIANGKKTIKE